MKRKCEICNDITIRVVDGEHATARASTHRQQRVGWQIDYQTDMVVSRFNSRRKNAGGGFDKPNPHS